MLTDDDPDRDKSKHYGLFKGVVVGRCDPMRLKRLKVRVAQIHGPDISVNDIPWAMPRGGACWSEGGEGGAPPLNEVVYIQFENGDHEYPVWEWGWWGQKDGEPQTPNSLLMVEAKHNVFPTSWYGGDQWPSGDILAMENGDWADPDNQPNNFGYVSPKQKRLELDDRKGRERILMGDWHGNILWTNSENGVISLESIGGNQTGGYRARGFILRSDIQSQELHMQYWSTLGWFFTIDDQGKFMNITSPSGHQVNIRDGSTDSGGAQDSVSLWTAGGHRAILSDTDQFAEIVSAGGRSMFINDKLGQTSLTGSDPNNYILIDDTHSKVSMMSAGDFTIKALGKLQLWGQALLDLDSQTQILFDGGNQDYAPDSFQKQDAGYQKIQEKRRMRASEFPYYQDPEKT
jgi:hypothetical protein